MLYKALAVNAAFSLMSALIMLVQTGWLMLHLPAPQWFWQLLAAGLLLFAIQLLAMLSRPELAHRLAPSVVFSDIGWIVASLAGLALFHPQISSTGAGLILGVNGIVALLALMQWLGYRRIGFTRRPV